MERNINLLILILAIGTFGILNTEMGIIGILPQIATTFGVNISEAGLFVSLFALGIAISGPIMPLVFSKFDRKNSFMFVLAIFVIFNILSALTTNFNLALIFRILPAFFHPIYCSLSLTVAAELVPKEEVPKATSKVIMGVSAGMVLGIPVTTYLTSLFSYQIAMLWFTLVNIIALIATIIYFPNMPGKKQSYGSQVNVLKTTVFLLATFTIIILNTGQTTAYAYISQFLQSVTHVYGLKLSIILLIYGLASLVGNYIGGHLLSKIPNKTVLVYPFLVSAIFIIIFFIGKFTIPTILFIGLWGLIFGIGNNIMQFWITSAAPNALEFANGMFLSMGNIGTAIGTSIGGLVIMSINTQFIFIIATIIMIISWLFFLLRVKKYPVIN